MDELLHLKTIFKLLSNSQLALIATDRQSRVESKQIF